MPRIFPFEGLVFNPAVSGPLARVTAPPYDVISDADRYRTTSPFSIVHVDITPSDGPGGVSQRYERAGDLLRAWEAQGALRRTPPGYFAYEMAFATDDGDGRVRGLLVALELRDPGDGIVPHERTMPGPVADRLRLLRATHTHVSPIYGTVEGPCAPLDSLLTATSERPADSEVVDEQGVRHRSWRIAEAPDVEAALSGASILIADGHHRYMTALMFRDELLASVGPGPWSRVLTLIVDASTEDLTVRPFHRVQLAGPVAQLGTPVRDLRAALDAVDDDEPCVALVTMRDGHPRFEVGILEGAPPAVDALHRTLLDDAVPPDALAYVPDAERAVAQVRSGVAVAAWLLPPTTTERIRSVVERGDRLPQKSTYFWPKPRTGLVMMPLDPALTTSPRAPTS